MPLGWSAHEDASLLEASLSQSTQSNSHPNFRPSQFALPLPPSSHLHTRVAMHIHPESREGSDDDGGGSGRGDGKVGRGGVGEGREGDESLAEQGAAVLVERAGPSAFPDRPLHSLTPSAPAGM